MFLMKTVVNEVVRIAPADSSTVLVQADRHSSELWKEVRETFRVLTNADLQIAQYYGTNPAFRSANLITVAHANLKNAEPNLTKSFGELTVFEEAERKRNSSQQ
jgi:hypothetical protein